VEERTAALMAAEETLHQVQKMEAVGQLTGGIAHDFNNMLQGISGSLDLMRTRIAEGRVGGLDRYIALAQDAAGRAAALTHRLLAFARRQTLDPKPTQVNRLVAGMEELIRRSVGPEITVETLLADDLCPTLCDPSQLENALLNLCINARDAMAQPSPGGSGGEAARPDGGRLVIETASAWVGAQAAREWDITPGGYVAISVGDTGAGMTPDVVGRAFEPFFTTKPLGQGTGLGLSMVYGFARQSGGQVRISSTVGQGTTIRILLPQYQGEVQEGEQTPEPASARRLEGSGTVLVVDDEPAIRTLIAELLVEMGYSALEAGDGLSGLQILRSRAAIDLLITDVGLPGGMNGRQMVDAARDARPALKVLFITGHAESATLGDSGLARGMHVLTKPFAMEALAAKINAVGGG
jgi:nitrogen-specific signal transduction histidine kinase/CheY-like chemotaxis protein